MHQLVAGIPGDVASYKLAIHAHLFTADLEVEYLAFSYLLHALLEQVSVIFPVIIHYFLTEQVISGRGGRGAGKVHQPQGTTD